ncbi:MAG: NAD-dependent epimerase/dehydratase family protein [Candidatus Acidoferrales bacterium]
MSGGRCLVLGGAGFLGSHLVELLVAEGYAVRVFDQPGRATHHLPPVLQQVEVVEGDFRQSGELGKAVEGCETAIHLVGTTVPSSSNRDPVFDLETNLVGTVRLLEACVQKKVKRVVFSSSGGTVYGEAQGLPMGESHPTEPRSSYGITKLACEKYLALFERLHGLDYTVLRIGNAYGPRGPVEGEQGVVGAFLARLKRGEPIPLWGDGSVVRDYVYVGDVARGFRAALGQQSSFRVFNISTGVGTSLRELIKKMEEVTGRRARIDSQAARPADIPVNVLDPRRAGQHLGWKATVSLEEGLRHTWEWLCSQEV